MNIPFALTNPFRFQSIEAINNDIDDELEFHIQCRVDELVSSGISADEAEQQARIAFGSADRIRKQCRRINYGGRTWLTFAVAGLVASVIVIGWLLLQLTELRDSNARLVEALSSAANASVLVAPASVGQEKQHDLSGKVAGPDGKPIEGAKVLLIYKSWPGGKFRQNAMSTKTDDAGNFNFEGLYSTDMQTAFLVSVVTDGYVLKSKYYVNEKRKVLDPCDMTLKKATLKTFVFLTQTGDPMANVKVFPQSRNYKPNGSGDFLYQHSANEVSSTTDAEGKVKLNYFAANDKIKLGVIQNGNIIDVEVKVDTKEEQVIGGKPAAGEAKTGKQDVIGTVTGEDGSAVVGATVLLVHKSWPNNQYRQDVFKTKTDMDGSFVFPKRYRLNEQYALLVSVVADGWAMQSEYLLDKAGNEADPFEFELDKATEKTFVFQNEEGKALKRVAVFPSTRKTDAGAEFMIYAQSGKNVDVKTDGDGKADFNCFEAGDTATFGFLQGGSVAVEVTDDAEQIVTVKKN